MKKFWLILAAVCGAIALFLVFKNDFDTAFVLAAIGAASWFLHYRVQLKETITPGDEHVNSGEDVDSNEE